MFALWDALTSAAGSGWSRRFHTAPGARKARQIDPFAHEQRLVFKVSTARIDRPADRRKDRCAWRIGDGQVSTAALVTAHMFDDWQRRKDQRDRADGSRLARLDHAEVRAVMCFVLSSGMALMDPAGQSSLSQQVPMDYFRRH